MFHPTVSDSVAEFVAAFAEPVSRPELVLEFQITVFSLYAAVSVGIKAATMIDFLDKYSKNEIDAELKRVILAHGDSFGRVKLVLRDGRH
eukprot:Selendium_serpulae@DN11873_c0_g1_i1.p1